ncbi:VIT domain-containing protein [Nibricoccus sp. IMCC34717]|uniref:VIT and vWA domain-containing protein n=1 Tax=Nibricoccus sp. IMCC34717 TaxID=3034021 RepID=UPI00384FEDE2
MKPIHPLRSLATALAVFVAPLGLFGAGTLTPVGSAQQPVEIRSHQANVVLNNGFAQVEVTQVFHNPNASDLEALYSFPVPEGATLAEVTITTGEKTMRGEVLPRPAAEKVYAQEKAAGNDAGLATRNSYQNFEYRVSPVRANADVTLRFTYYQPLKIDAGVGRFVYPLEEGGTDDAAKGFWTTNPVVQGTLGIRVELKSAVPVTDVRLPGFETTAVVEKVSESHFRASVDRTGARLDRDFVFYYRLADNLPGRVEVIPYRAAKDKPGSFMMVVTPGVDLQPLKRGADYVYVLDVSGSMQGKLGMLANGVAQSIGQMRPEDRFRVVTFNNGAQELIGWTPATPENVRIAAERVKQLQPSGGTNLFEGVKRGLERLDNDRATSLVLVTDGVANEGVVSPKPFRELLQRYDLRVFGFLMGNNANWPLMRSIAEATGGFYQGVGNEDDIVGQLLLAKGKIAFEALHDASFRFTGARVFDTTGDLPGKIYRGQQLVVFGRYEGAGKATVTLKARLTGEDKTYTASFDFPEVATENPEIERLWAMAQVEQLENKQNAGLVPEAEAKDAITHLGVTYSLVTDHTAMVVLDDEANARNGIERLNLARSNAEAAAQLARAGQPTVNYRVDANQPAFPTQAPHVNHFSLGGGAFEFRSAGLVVLCLIGFAVCLSRLHAEQARRDRRQKRE